MKATLSFKLPEEREDFELANRAAAVESALTDFANYLRSQIKYYPAEGRSDALDLKTLEAIREKFYEFMNDVKELDA